MKNLEDKTLVRHTADSYEVPTVVDLGTLEDLTRGGPTNVPDVPGLGFGSAITVPPTS